MATKRSTTPSEEPDSDTWPCADTDLKRIFDCLQKDLDDAHARYVQGIVLSAMRGYWWDRSRPKTNAFDEIAALADALRNKIGELSFEFFDERDDVLISVQEELAHLTAFPTFAPPQHSKGGRPRYFAEEQMIIFLRHAWTTAHGGRNPHGFWKFFRACLTPLAAKGILPNALGESAFTDDVSEIWKQIDAKAKRARRRPKK
jgi:hypothetical protein